MEVITQLFSDSFVQAIGWTVVHSIWQATLIALVVGILLVSVPKRSAKKRYDIAVLGLLSIFISAVTTFFYFYQGEAVATPEEDFTIYLMQDMQWEVGEPMVQSFLELCQSYFDSHLPLIVGLWLLGFTFFLFRLLGGLIYIQHLRMRCEPLKDALWIYYLQELADKLPTKKTIKLAESALVKVPMVVGHIKPIILFPIGMINHLSTEEVEAILAHELAHIYRNDYLVNIIQSIIETLFYYHPAIWWLSWIIQVEREHCCDDIAVRLSGSPLTYAKALVRLQEMVQLQTPTFAMSFAGTKNQFLTRIQRLLNHPQKNSNFMEKLIATGLLTLAVFLISLHADAKFPTLNTVIDHLSNTDKGAIELPVVEENSAMVNPIISNATVPFTKVTPFLPLIKRDTVPSKSKKNNHYSYYFNDGESYEVKSKDGKIIVMKVNGKEVPAEDYEKYQEKFGQKAPTPPTPPTPPTAPVAPTPPTPPTPPTGFQHFDNDNQTVIRTIDEDGNSVIIIESDKKDKPIRIKIKDGAKSSISIEGDDLEDGKIVILDEDLEEYINNSLTEWFDENEGFEVEIEEWAEEFGESMEEWGEEFGKTMEAWAEQFEGEEDFDFDFEFDSELTEEQKAEIRRSIEEHREEIQEYREEVRENMEEQRQEIRKERERMREEQQRNREERVGLFEGISLISESFDANRMIYNQLSKDGFVKDGKKFSYKIDSKHLSINGKKQPTSVHKKYLQILERAIGRSLKSNESAAVKGKMTDDRDAFKGSVNFELND